MREFIVIKNVIDLQENSFQCGLISWKSKHKGDDEYSLGERVIVMRSDDYEKHLTDHEEEKRGLERELQIKADRIRELEGTRPEARPDEAVIADCYCLKHKNPYSKKEGCVHCIVEDRIKILEDRDHDNAKKIIEHSLSLAQCFICGQCGNIFAKEKGKCPHCNTKPNT